MSIEKLLDHLEGDAERIKTHVAIIRNGLSMVNPNKDVRMEIDNSLWELFRVTHFFDDVCTQMSQEVRRILGYDSTDENDDDVEHILEK